MGKERLDVRVHALGLAESREKARALIMAGSVYVDGRRSRARRSPPTRPWRCAANASRT